MTLDMRFLFSSLFATLLLSSNLVFAKDTVPFSKKKIKVADQILEVEIAETDDQLQRGLMFRKELPEGRGMLFIYNQERPLSFWMKNTFIPLAIGFFNKDKKLMDWVEMSPVVSEMQTNIPTYRSKGPAMYALEVPKGWFTRNKLQVGAQFSFVK